MFGRGARESERSRGLRLFAASAGLAIAGATVLAMAPANASGATVDAQLSLSGVATKDNILGGTTIGVHPGDKVDFKASALPTAGLDNIPALGTLLNGVLGSLTASTFQVVLHLPANFPGGKRDVTLGGPTSGDCKGASDLPVAFPKAGTYQFTWQVEYITPGLLGLGCKQNGVNSASLNALKSAGVALNASNSWVGQIVAAADPPTGGISIQLPGISVAPSLPVVGQLPTVGVSPINVPTIPVTIPKLPGLPGSKTTGSNPGQGGNAGSGSTYTPPGLSIPQEVVPSGDGNGPGTVNNTGFGNALPNLGGGNGGGGNVTTSTGANGQVTTLGPGNSQQKAKSVELAANPSPSAQMPVLLAIIAIIALSLVTATYARLYLLRRTP